MFLSSVGSMHGISYQTMCIYFLPEKPPGRLLLAAFPSLSGLLSLSRLPFFSPHAPRFREKIERVVDRVRDGWSEMRGADTILLSLFFAQAFVVATPSKRTHIAFPEVAA